MLNYRWTNQFKKDYKQQIRRGKDSNKIDAIISDLVDERPLDPALKDHPLKGDLRQWATDEARFLGKGRVKLTEPQLRGHGQPARRLKTRLLAWP